VVYPKGYKITATIILSSSKNSERLIFISMILPVKAEKEKTSTIICFISGSTYCGKCDKLVIMYDKNYMQYDIYN
jgi:hypothetical protein